MRDYRLETPRGAWLISDAPLEEINSAIGGGFMEITPDDPPGTTSEGVMERLRIERQIRSLGLRS